MGYDSNDRDDGTFEKCPFCGGKVDLRIYDVPFSQQHYFYINCFLCDVKVILPNAKTVSAAIITWNRRYK